MIATDGDGRAPAGADQLVDRKTGTGAVAVAEPANPRRETLELDATGRQLEPATKEPVVREQLEELAIDGLDVGGLPRKRCPSKRPHSATEERSNIGRDEARVCKCVRYARAMCFSS